MRTWPLLIGTLLIGACSRESPQRTVLRYDDDVSIVTVIESSGGALGDETYRVSYRFQGKETRFFEGANPGSFSVRRIAEGIAIRFCDGSVRLAQPIFLGPPRSKLLHLRLDLDCADRRVSQ